MQQDTYDAALLDIRAKEQYARALSVTSDGARTAWEWGNYLFAILVVAGIGVVTLGRRRRAVSLILLAEEKKS